MHRKVRNSLLNHEATVMIIEVAVQEQLLPRLCDYCSVAEKRMRAERSVVAASATLTVKEGEGGKTEVTR